MANGIEIRGARDGDGSARTSGAVKEAAPCERDDGKRAKPRGGGADREI
jgi:hypothetical protein